MGSNLGEREHTIRRALALLAAAPGVELRRVSSLRETDPVGPIPDQPRFLNGAAEVETELPAEELLARLLAIEAELGRDRKGPRGGPRTIDLDLLVYEDAVLDSARLVVPHPRLAEREFVLEPLAELNPELDVPGLGPVADLLRRLESSPRCRTSTSWTSTRPSSRSG